MKHKITKKSLAQARRISSKRSQHAQDVDRGELSRLTTNPDVYAIDPSRFDFPYVDTPDFWNEKHKGKKRGFSAWM